MCIHLSVNYITISFLKHLEAELLLLSVHLSIWRGLENWSIVTLPFLMSTVTGKHFRPLAFVKHTSVMMDSGEMWEAVDKYKSSRSTLILPIYTQQREQNTLRNGQEHGHTDIQLWSHFQRQQSRSFRWFFCSTQAQQRRDPCTLVGNQ